MKKAFLLPLALLTFTLFSCSDDDDSTGNELNTESTLETIQITNLHADAITDQMTRENSGEFTKFDFETGTITESKTDWDIAFRTTTIAINGGIATGTVDEPEKNSSVEAAIVDASFAEVTTAEGVDFTQDSADGFAIPTGSDNGWYNYEPTTNIITAIPGKVLVFKTRNGNYAKLEIKSYYLNQDQSNESRYYTFNYVYNPEVGNTSF